VCPEKMSSLTFLCYQVKGCPELKVVKRTQTCTYLGFCSQIL